MASSDPPVKPEHEVAESAPPPVANARLSAFYGFLKQALTLGLKRVRPSAVPQVLGFFVYVALVGLLATSLIWNRPKAMAAAIVMLILVALMAILLLFDIPRRIHPIVANIILVLVVAAFLAISAYAVVKLLANNDEAGDSLSALEKKCMGGSASACSELDQRVQLTCRYDAACIARAQCWQDKSRALVLLHNVCDTNSANYNADGCVIQRQNSGAQAKANCDLL
jgi:hypothetical protein